jgi:hypothetical protein
VAFAKSGSYRTGRWLEFAAFFAMPPVSDVVGRVGGCLVTGNEDGVKHCAMNLLYSLQHLGYTIPPQADSGWIGEAGPGPSYLDDGSGGPENDFTNRNTTFAAWNMLHLARMLKDAGGIPAPAISGRPGTPAAVSTSPTRSTGSERRGARAQTKELFYMQRVSRRADISANAREEGVTGQRSGPGSRRAVPRSSPAG